MKAYTDINQSKKLTEILPLESADMEYLAIKEIGKLVGTVPFVKDDSEIEDSAYSHIYDRIVCWSLSALIDIIPQELFNGEYIINITEGRNHKWIISYDTYSGVSSYIDVSSDNLIDCCVEMIIKLKKKEFVMKSYTDLNQSKKLVEILPIESADMIYTMTNGYHTPFIRIETIQEMDKDDVPCWSLAALLGVLPFHLIVNNQRYAFGMHKGLNKDGETYMLRYNVFNTDVCLYSTDYYNNSVDACVAMIEKLNELNLL